MNSRKFHCRHSKGRDGVSVLELYTQWALSRSSGRRLLWGFHRWVCVQKCHLHTVNGNYQGSLGLSFLGESLGPAGRTGMWARTHFQLSTQYLESQDLIRMLGRTTITPGQKILLHPWVNISILVYFFREREKERERDICFKYRVISIYLSMYYLFSINFKDFKLEVQYSLPMNLLIFIIFVCACVCMCMCVSG